MPDPAPGSSPGGPDCDSRTRRTPFRASSMTRRRSLSPATDTSSSLRRSANCCPLLGRQCQAHGLEGVLLRRRRGGSFPYVADEVGIVRGLDLRAVDVLRTFLIDQEQVVTAVPSRDVDVLAQL